MNNQSGSASRILSPLDTVAAKSSKPRKHGCNASSLEFIQHRPTDHANLMNPSVYRSRIGISLSSTTAPCSAPEGYIGLPPAQQFRSAISLVGQSLPIFSAPVRTIVRYAPDSDRTYCCAANDAKCHVWTASNWQDLSSRFAALVALDRRTIGSLSRPKCPSCLSWRGRPAPTNA